MSTCWDRGWGVGIVLFGAALGGCDEEASGSSSLCPNCEATPAASGGLTAASVVDCQYRISEVTDAQRVEWQLAALGTRVTTPIQSELQWERPNFDGGDPELFEKTMVNGSISLGAFQFFESATCGNHAAAPATADWSTRDGALQVETQGELRVDVRDISWRLEAHAGLETATGSLDVPIDRVRPHTGRVSAYVVPARAVPVAGPDRLVGSIGVTVAYLDNVGPSGFISSETPFMGVFPPRPAPARCSPGQTSVPNAPDDPCPQFGTDCSRAGLLATTTCEESGRYANVCECPER